MHNVGSLKTPKIQLWILHQVKTPHNLTSRLIFFHWVSQVTQQQRICLPMQETQGVRV